MIRISPKRSTFSFFSPSSTPCSNRCRLAVLGQDRPPPWAECSTVREAAPARYRGHRMHADLCVVAGFLIRSTPRFFLMF